MKLKTGFFSFACCKGCMTTIIEVPNIKYDKWIKKISNDTIDIFKNSSINLIYTDRTNKYNYIKEILKIVGKMQKMEDIDKREHSPY